MTDLSDSYVKIRAKISKSDGGNLDAFVNTAGSENSVGFINQPATSMFSGINFRLGDELLTDSFQTYPFLAHLQCLLNFSSDARKSRLSLLQYYDEKNPGVVRADAASDDSGFKKRASLSSRSKEVTMITNIFHGMFNQTRYLPALCPWSIEFVKASNEFCLKSNAAAPTFKYTITSMQLFVRKIRMRPSYNLYVEQRLAKEMAIYPIRHATVRPFYIDAREKTVSYENIFMGRPLPDLVLISLLPQTAYRGSYDSSPFLFKNHSVTGLKLSVDGEQFPNPDGFKPNYTSTTSPDWTKEYLALNDNLIKIDSGTFITQEMFPETHCLYTIRFGAETTPARDHVIPKKTGSCRLDVTFAPTSSNPALVLLVYSESDEIIGIDANRRCHREYYL